MKSAGRLIAALAAAALAGCAQVREEPPEEAPAIVGAWSAAALVDLVAAAEAAPMDGLPAETAALNEIAQFQSRAARDAVASAQLDMAADALFASLARSYAHGAVDPTTADPQWLIAAPPPPDIEALLARRAAGESASAIIRDLAPQAEAYRLLREEFARVSAEPEGSLDAQNRTREARLRSLRASLERWRWLPRDLPAARVEVRVPHFEAVRLENETTMQRHAVIVGARATQTPTFAAEIRSVTLNPYWEPPRSILVNELLPRFRGNPAAASRENYEVLDTQGRAVALDSVDWAARPFPYRLRQRPGPGNALGRIRFDLPNPYAVFLHDTPSRSLFARADRALSHGCIRVENPVDLAASILASPDWNAAALNAEIDLGATRTIEIASPAPVYVLYITAASGADGSVAYADDIYGRDEGVVAALDAPDVSLASEPSHAALSCSA
jgi:murein L,D-transpeptidase YcbB/YkuD